MRVYLESLGCRLNAAEIEALARRFVGGGHVIVDDPEGADLIVLNSCAVTAQASRRTRHRLRALHRSEPAADIAVTGCWATEDLDRAGEFPAVRWVVPNADKRAAVAEITGTDPAPAPWAPGRWGHTRAFLGVQDGCDHACTYCVTRILRGPARSRPLDASLAAVADLVAQGAQEVVLTGVSLGSYGQDLGVQHGLADLVAAILDETELRRLRLSSIEPWDVDDELLQCWSNPRLCRQLHLPLQSGSDAVLRQMGRPIKTDRFRELAAAARTIVPEIAITTDLIAGFPGESQADFHKTLAFVEEIGFSRLHVFPYSERAATTAVRLPGRVPKSVRKARARKLRALGHTLAAAYRARFIGEVLPVLWERTDDDGAWLGWTDNYLSVRTASERDLYNLVVPTRIVAESSTHRGRLDGEILLD